MFRKMDDEKEKNKLSDEVIHLERVFKLFAEYGFTKADMQKLIFHKPKILDLSKLQLKRQLIAFRKLDFTLDVIRAMILKCPGLLTLKIDEVSLQDRVCVNSFITSMLSGRTFYFSIV